MGANGPWDPGLWKRGGGRKGRSGSRQPRGVGRFWVEGGVGLLRLTEGVDGVSCCWGWVGLETTFWFRSRRSLEGPLKASKPAQAGVPWGRVAGVWREARSSQPVGTECCPQGQAVGAGGGG